jgi:hypothetical protein
LEAVVAALQVSEPNTQGLSELLAAFDAMVDGQLAHPNMKHHWRRNLKRSGDGKNIPRALAGDLNHVVAAYGESAPINGPDGTLRGPIYWVAERLGTGEQFAGKIMPREPLRSTFLDHLQLSNAEFENAGCVPSFRTAWNEFFRSDDTLAVYHKRTADLLKNISAAYEPHVVLKSIRLGDSPAPSGTRTLDQWLAALRISTPAARFPGRAGQRLAQASALIQYLHAQAE